MSSSKRGTAITGDLFRVEHPTLDLSDPFTSHVDIGFDGITHQVLSTADRSAFNYATTTGEFTVGELRGHIIESIDTVQTQATHRYQAVVSSPTGVLSTQTYLSATAAIELVAALRPTPTALGIAIDPDDSADIVSDPRVAMATPLGIIECTPLTPDVDSQLPEWSGTPVDHGELYGGSHADGSPWLTLVTTSARVILMLGANVSADDGADGLAQLNVIWTA